MKRCLVLTIGILVLAGAALRAQSAAVDAGKKVYEAQKCATCHMIAGKGGTMTKLYPLDGVATKLKETDIRKWLTTPAEMEAKLEKKPAVKMSSKKFEFKDADLNGLVAYLMTLKK